MDEWSAAEQAELKKVFYSGAYELVEDLQDALLKLEADLSDNDTLKVVKRYVHTLKGDSNSVGLASVGRLCHRMEDVLSLVTPGGDESHDAIGLLLSCIDALVSSSRRARPETGRDDRRG